jgi:uncharacterized protein (TIGR02246 family)
MFRNLALLLAPLIALGSTSAVSAMSDHSQSEQAIRSLQETFAKGIMTNDPKLRVSIFAADATLAPPTGGFFEGRAAIEKDFETESASNTSSTTASFANFRFRFVTPSYALVDTDLIIHNVLGPDGKPIPTLNVRIVFTAVHRAGTWLVQGERAHFVPPPPT